MTNEERFKKYVKEHCNNCKNRESDLCDIRIFSRDNTIYTKCNYYEKEKVEKKKKILNVTANKKKPIMKGII